MKKYTIFALLILMSCTLNLNASCCGGSRVRSQPALPEANIDGVADVAGPFVSTPCVGPSGSSESLDEQPETTPTTPSSKTESPKMKQKPMTEALMDGFLQQRAAHTIPGYDGLMQAYCDGLFDPTKRDVAPWNNPAAFLQSIQESQDACALKIWDNMMQVLIHEAIENHKQAEKTYGWSGELFFWTPNLFNLTVGEMIEGVYDGAPYKNYSNIKPLKEMIEVLKDRCLADETLKNQQVGILLSDELSIGEVPNQRHKVKSSKLYALLVAPENKFWGEKDHSSSRVSYTAHPSSILTDIMLFVLSNWVNSTYKNGSFEDRVASLINRFRVWKNRRNEEYKNFVTFLGFCPEETIDRPALSEKLKAFMASTKDGKLVIPESPMDVEKVLQQFVIKRKDNTFNLLHRYQCDGPSSAPQAFQTNRGDETEELFKIVANQYNTPVEKVQEAWESYKKDEFERYKKRVALLEGEALAAKGAEALTDQESINIEREAKKELGITNRVWPTLMPCPLFNSVMPGYWDSVKECLINIGQLAQDQEKNIREIDKKLKLINAKWCGSALDDLVRFISCDLSEASYESDQITLEKALQWLESPCFQCTHAHITYKAEDHSPFNELYQAYL